MTVEEIANTLNDCANKKLCPKCIFEGDLDCKALMVKAMGKEARKYAAMGKTSECSSRV